MKKHWSVFRILMALTFSALGVSSVYAEDLTPPETVLESGPAAIEAADLSNLSHLGVSSCEVTKGGKEVRRINQLFIDLTEQA